MQAIRRIGLIAVFAASSAYGQPTQSLEVGKTTPASPSAQAIEAIPGQPGPDARPAVIAQPPAPPQLAPLSPDFQAAMANSQIQTYRYNQLTEQALALKKLCDTGFGPADICPKANTVSVDGLPPSETTDLPTVAEISGSHGALRAVLILVDGRRVLVRASSTLPNGFHVTAVTEDDVRVSKSAGREITLSFNNSAPAN